MSPEAPSCYLRQAALQAGRKGCMVPPVPAPFECRPARSAPILPDGAAHLHHSFHPHRYQHWLQPSGLLCSPFGSAATSTKGPRRQDRGLLSHRPHHPRWRQYWSPHLKGRRRWMLSMLMSLMAMSLMHPKSWTNLSTIAMLQPPPMSCKPCN